MDFLRIKLLQLGPQELARQNQITKQILEAYIQKKLGLAKSANLRPPSVLEILPVKKKEERLTRQLIYREEEKDEAPPEVEEMEDEEDEETEEEPAPVEDEKLQSVESEHIDSVYPKGM
ncbi:unnamed protein product [Parnassius apollo]|uniref:(apollo) hypothetical protein n=1 Tax=Parnassius apollo TaxID=110799 RepID=A0A8S3W8I1_PARAO|nr:unnamed protein product [Parnassius apollo]